MIKAIATSVAQYVTVKTFATALRGLVVEELVPTLEEAGRPLSGTEPFPFSRPTFEASKTVFNLVAADNEFERDFAHFLQDATDVRVVRQAARSGSASPSSTPTAPPTSATTSPTSWPSGTTIPTI